MINKRNNLPFPKGASLFKGSFKKVLLTTLILVFNNVSFSTFLLEQSIY